MAWYKFSENKPAAGNPVIVAGEWNKGKANRDIAYYFDGDFFKLGLDPVLGILRKEHIDYPVKEWTEIYIG